MENNIQIHFNEHYSVSKQILQTDSRQRNTKRETEKPMDSNNKSDQVGGTEMDCMLNKSDTEVKPSSNLTFRKYYLKTQNGLWISLKMFVILVLLILIILIIISIAILLVLTTRNLLPNNITATDSEYFYLMVICCR